MADIISWPWTRILLTKYRAFYFHRNSVGTVRVSEIHLNSGIWTSSIIAELGLSTFISQFDVADFGPFYVISTLGKDAAGALEIQTLIRDTTFSSVIGSMSSINLPAFGTCLNFNGQLIGGNLRSSSYGNDHFSEGLSSNAIIWSAIGSLEFDPSEDKTAGWMDLFFPYVSGQRAAIYRLMKMGRGSIIAYSDSGNIILTPGSSGNTFTYGQDPFEGPGIILGSHIAGDDNVHGLIDRNNEFWTLEGGNFTKLGYKEYMEEMTSSDIVVSYLPRDRRFYVSDGITCVIINRFGAYKANQRVSSIALGHDNKLYGTFSEGLDLVARIVSDIIDYGSRDIKNIESMVAGIQFDGLEAAKFGVDWRMGVRDSFIRSELRTMNPSGEATVQVAASEFRIVIEVIDPVNVEISYIMSNVKFSDRKFRRGLAPGATRGNEVVRL